MWVLSGGKRSIGPTTFLCLAAVLLFTYSLDARAQTGDASTQLQQARSRLQGLQSQQQTLGQALEDLRETRRRLQRQNESLRKEQERLQEELGEAEGKLKKARLPRQYLQERCNVLEKQHKHQRARKRLAQNQQSLAEIQQQIGQTQQQISQTQQQISQTQQQISQTQQQISQTQQQITQAQQQLTQLEQAATQTTTSGALDRAMMKPADPLGGLPAGLAQPSGRSVQLVSLGFATATANLVATISWDPSTNSFRMSTGGTPGSFFARVLLTMSDGSLQPLRRRVFRDWTTWPSPPVQLGLIEEVGPTMMTAPIVDAWQLFNKVTENVPAGWVARGRIIYDVPADPSIEPLVLYYEFF
ncbi:hypothetical protein ACFL2Q_14870 [Thermodesulfobacteriota bacterium]